MQLFSVLLKEGVVFNKYNIWSICGLFLGSKRIFWQDEGGLNKYRIWSFCGLLGGSNRFFWSRRGAFWRNTKFGAVFCAAGGGRFKYIQNWAFKSSSVDPPKCQNIKASKANCTKTQKQTTQSFLWSRWGGAFWINTKFGNFMGFLVVATAFFGVEGGVLNKYIN